MRPRCPPRTALCAALLLTLSPRLAVAQVPACRSSSDVLYAVKRAETLSEIAARFYCATAEPTITHVWEAVYDYNRVVAGPNPHAIPIDTVLCLPAHVDGAGWQADRCVASTLSTQPTRASECGNDRREETEVCDGADLAGMTCTKLGLLPGKLSCRADCAGFDPAGCGREASAPLQEARSEKRADAASQGDADEARARRGRDERDRALTRKREGIVRRVSAELTGGVTVPFSGDVWGHFYRVLAMTGVGARVTLGWVEVAPRALFIGGQHGTVFNDVEEQQRVLGGGLSVQAGVPLRVGPIRVTPGVEVGWIYVHRAVELTEYPWKGTEEELSSHLPIVGVFVRSEYVIPRFSHFSIALELGSDLLPVRLARNSVTTVTANFNAKMLGGLGYVF